MNGLLIDIKREFVFLLRQKNVQILLFFAFAVSVFSITTGLLEIDKQRQTIERLIDYDHTDRQGVIDKYNGYGSMAYYSRHLTYAAPSALAFSAIGQRDVLPWKHRIKVLAIEGQIYETDADNPELAYVGRIDFAFLISVLTPLFVILLLHDVKAAERAGGRFELLLTSSQHPERLWITRILVGAVSLTLALVIPFIAGALISGTQTIDVLFVLAICLGQILFWAAVCYWIGKVNASAPQLASILLGLWLLTTIIIPVAGAKYIDEIVDSPEGGDIVLTQREAVNGAWDKPYHETFDAFLSTHPTWKDHVAMTNSFDWKWYFAFQQVGDQTAQSLSVAYRQATVRKNELAGIVAWFSPAMMVQRSMTEIAETDTSAMLRYQQSIRDFHAELRQFYYPFLFYGTPYNKAEFEQRPEFQANTHPSS